MFIRLILFALCSLPAFAQVNDKIHRYEETIYWPDEIFVLDENKEKYYFDQFEDKFLLIVFWATWCSYCIEEMPSLDVLKKDFRKLPIEIIAVSEDNNGISVIKKFFDNKNIRHLKILLDENFKLFNELKASGLPVAFWIKPNGRIELKFAGAINWHDDYVRKILLSYMPKGYEEPKNSYKINRLLKSKEK